MAAQPRQTPTMGRSSAGGDTTYTKIFVGGLAWETQHDTMRRYFEQFGEILEAVVIADKHTGRSKGYGFVTFKDPDSAIRACEDPVPVIDGRRANCNLASLGAAQRPRPPTPQPGTWRFRPAMGSAQASYSYRPAAASSTAYFHQPAQYAYTYPFYGYSGGYPQESMYPMSYYGIGRGGQQHHHHHHSYSPYYPAGPGIVHHGFHPYYPQYAHSSQAQGGFLGQMPQFPYLPQQYGSSSGIISLPTSIAATTAVVTIAAPPQQPGTAAPDLHPPA